MKNEVALAGYEALLRNMKNEKFALRFMRAKIAEQFASASRRNAPLHVCEANASLS
jgi:hypothetical protein